MIRRSLLTLALATSAVAQTNEVRQFPPVIITGTRIPEELSDTPNSVTVVPREQIDEQQRRTVADALRDVVGVDIVCSGQPGQQTAAFLRGARGEQTLVLIDGVKVNNPFNNAFDFANLSVDNIDHIEVIRGPQSTLYGSEAIGGVINIVTKQCAGKPTGAVTVEGGSENSLRAAGSFAGSFDKLYLSAESSYVTTENERDNAYDRAWNASGHATYQLLDRLTASVLATYLQSKAGSPNDRFVNDPNDFLHYENSLVALTLDGQPTEWWTSKLILSYAHERNFFSGTEPNPPNFFGDFIELTVTDRDQADFQNIFKLADGHKLLLGGTYDHSEADDASTFGTTQRSVDNRAAYAQYEFTALPRFTGTAGGRVDDYTTFGTHGTYRFGGRFTTPVTETILRGSVGTGFRAPTIRDFFPPFGNPDLKPEESLGWDAGFEQPVGNVRFGATYFQNEFDDLIQFGFPAPTNTGKAETAGVETFATWTPLTNLTLRGAYTWMPDAEDRINNLRLVRRPEHAGNISVAYKFLDRFTAAGNATFVGERRDQKFNPVTFASTRVTNAGYIKLDLSLSCDVCKYFTVFGRAENLLDDQYEEAFGFPALGRTFWGGGTVRF